MFLVETHVGSERVVTLRTLELVRHPRNALTLLSETTDSKDRASEKGECRPQTKKIWRKTRSRRDVGKIEISEK